MGAREELAAVLDPRVTASLGTAEWACDPLPSCPQYAHVNPDWLRAIIAEAKAVREWLTSPALARLLDEARREAWDEGWEAGKWGASRRAIRLGSCCVNVGTAECACERPTNWGGDRDA